MEIQKTLPTVISVLGKAFIVLAVFLALKARNYYDEYLAIKIPDEVTNLGDPENQADLIPIEKKINLILARSLLGASEKEQVVSESPKKKSDLKFRLVGTTLAPGIAPIAIIEDSSSKKQDAFSPGENVFDQAILKEVLVDRVSIQRDGQLEVIEVSDGESLPGDPNQSNIRGDGGNFVVPEDEINSALSNLPVLLSQARAVPYFRNGQSVGMRLYAIRSGSLYEKLGLKNSDIIKQVNNSPVNDPTKALKLFEDLKSQRSISVGVEREGQDLQLNYQIR